MTIPASIRKTADLDIGFFLEAEIRKDGILLIPKTITDRNVMLKKFRTAFSEPVQDKAFAGKSDEALMKIANKAVKETRTAKRSKNK